VSYAMDTEVLSPGVMVLGREVKQSHPSIAGFKNEWNCTSARPCMA
jgi:hypothetical protein